MRKKVTEKILDVDASMQGSLVFKDPVNLRINGSFEGKLDTKGNLTIGENSSVRADIRGEDIVIAGEVNGNIIATNSLRIAPPARVIGDIRTPVLNVVEGAVLQGNCTMISGGESVSAKRGDYLSTEEVASYLDVEPSLVVKWVNDGRLPGIKEKNSWKFERSTIDKWITKEKVK